jgi:uncharacterized iron-regulated membrane protein
MPSLRTVLFWLHLTAGVLAGVVILIMSVTGVALTYEKQMLEWADRRAWSAPPPAGTERLTPETLLANVVQARPDAAPTTLTLRADPRAPATVALDGGGSLLVDPYSGAVIGTPPTGLRTFFRTMTNWHRWLAMQNSSRAMGKGITGAANLLFLFIVLSGIYLWVPRIWTRLQFRNVLWFRRGLTPKARDFNWHNVIGVWSAIPLAIVVAGAVPISYPWASNLVYRLAGEEPPKAAPRGGPPAGRPQGGSEGREARERTALDLSGLDQGFAVASGHVDAWRSMAIRLPQAPNADYVFTIDEGYGGQPQKRGTLTLNRATGAVAKWETFADLSSGRQWRSWLRFAHTGEIYGLTGQTIAGLVSAGGAVLVWTGIALAFRRLTAWIGRRKSVGDQGDRQQAA